jgi:Tfp pilus assembly protein PilX
MMNAIKRRLASALGAPDAGFAMIMVMGIGLVVLLIVTTAVSVSVSDMLKARGDQDWSGAEAAAYAGVADYESRLANNNTYYLYGNPASTFSPTNSVHLPTTTNPAFSLGAAGIWASVPGSNNARFRYEVDNTKYASTGIIRLRSTGIVGTSMRTVIANVKQHGFVDFMYYTQYELADPQQTNTSCVPTYDWQSNHSSQCTEIQFAPSDVINGPVHSNDTILVCGSTFTGTFSTSDPVAPYYTPVGGCSAPTFSSTPTTSPTIDMPPTNAQMKQETRSDLTGSTVPNPGCLYTGPTSVTFTSDGKMTIRSPFTKATQVTADASGTVNGGSAPAQCGTPGTGAGALGSSAGATINVLNSNLMFVQDVPTAAGDPNSTASTTYPSGFTCNNTSTLSGWKFGTLAYPMSGEVTPTASPVHYGCRKGDIYVSGSMHGTMTMAADNYIYVTGDLTYFNPLTDMLGLVGNNAVWVWNPVNSSGTPLLAKNREIDAAILSINHTFQVQNYTSGSSTQGTLTVFGAIAQKFRGTVGQSTNGTSITQGYSKNYNYDKRLQYQAPPKFLSPVAATYGISQLIEVGTPFNVDGSYKP